MIGKSTLLVAIALCSVASAGHPQRYGNRGGVGGVGFGGAGVGGLGAGGVHSQGGLGGFGGASHLGGVSGGLGGASHLGGVSGGLGGAGHLGGVSGGLGGAGHLGGVSGGFGGASHLGGVAGGLGGAGLGVGSASYNPAHYPDIIPGFPFQSSFPGRGFSGCQNWCLSSVQNNYYCCTRTTYAG
ncbi:PE-PGRS family protein PE_PGRS47-like [Palaemon carinicauda]|uniref:PE-PGRS family protein PE_PGRS47-like n=1 Tax=Palaemon carinicauda TaxID=392227 RepID=UPI0035B69D8C